MPEANRYSEKYRPQFHFTARENWLNDPNGCVFHDGEYHLFFQHNPVGREWANMTWGHAVSRDLVRWRQIGNALHPYEGGTIYSGSAVVDAANTSGFARQGGVPLVAAFTHAREPFGQAIAFSNDNGRNWELYAEGRHVVPNQGLDAGERDPRIRWHEPTGRWVMVLWVARGQARFFASEDLKHWTHTGDFKVEDFHECPDLFCLPLDGDAGRPKWILHDAAFRYWIGDFDGRRFVPEAGPMWGDVGASFYAAQTWTHTGRRVFQIGWMRGGKYPGMPFNQQMSFPCELSLRTTPRGVRLCRMPVEAIATLRSNSDFIESHALAQGKTLQVGRPADLVDVELTVASSASFSVRLGGQDVTCSGGRIRCLGKEADLPPSGGVVSLRILVDRTSIELFGNEGEISMSSCFLSPDKSEPVQVTAGTGGLDIRRLAVHQLSSAWRNTSDAPGAG